LRVRVLLPLPKWTIENSVIFDGLFFVGLIYSYYKGY